jgi:sarcosine oxidase/L-pipecolate oxidase/L-saccharopine oxidase
VSTGETYTADKILIALGASTGYIVDLENQIRSLGLFITHIHLTEDEYLKYSNIPIFFSSEMGYFFPPDSKTHDLKFALTFGDTSNKVADPHNMGNQVYLPRFSTKDSFPAPGESHVRRLLRLVLPELADHQLYKSKVCWISDTTTSDFLIDKIPATDNVFIATGDSGHGYKFLPNIGKYISLKLQGNLDEESSDRWKWKANPEFPTQFQNRAKREHFDIKDVKEWWIDNFKETARL